MSHITIVWGLWGPYHCRRFEALRDHATNDGHRVTGASLFSGSRDYQWSPTDLPEGVVHFNLGTDETKFPAGKIGRLLALPRELQTNVALLPSYDHWSLALNVATRLSGGRVVMMNETHGGTARAGGLKAALKQKVVAGFHAAFVGGAPHRRYFAALGLPPEKIFTGYDAVDNDYFSQQAGEVTNRRSEVRRQYNLPEHYFLNLGRFVAKKNLATLVRAYRKLLDARPDCPTHLVLVGSGEEESKLRALAGELQLPVHDKTRAGNEKQPAGNENELPGVHFYGFRQIKENPIFYALADGFILPSRYEEWGLVVNEAMACGLPVVVSETAGCAEDLLKPGCLSGPVQLSPASRERLARFAGRIRQNGFVFNPTSVDMLADTLILLADNPDIRQQMGQASRVLVRQFSCENFARNALLAARVAMGEDISVPRNVPTTAAPMCPAGVLLPSDEPGQP